METFIYQLGAWVFAIGCTGVLFAIVGIIEGAKK